MREPEGCQLRTLGNTYLSLHQPCNFFGHGMFYLQAGIGFHEVKPAGLRFQQKLNSAKPAVVHGFAQSHCSVTHRLTDVFSQPGGRAISTIFW